MQALLPLSVGVASALVVAAGAHAPAARADTLLTSCAPADFAAAAAAGGTVTFGLDCPDLVLAKTIVLGSGKVLDVEGGGHAVALDGGHAQRLFTVNGGHLTVRGVTLENGL